MLLYADFTLISEFNAKYMEVAHRAQSVKTTSM